MESLSIRSNDVAPKATYKHLMVLTPREKQILEMICDGMSNEEIARHLNIQVATVKFHLKKVYSVFQAKKRHAVIIQAVKTGAVRPSWIREVSLS